MADQEKAEKIIRRLRDRSFHFLNTAYCEADGELLRSAHCLIEDLLQEIEILNADLHRNT